MEIAIGISILTVLISAGAVYYNFLKEADIEVYLGDSLNIVRHTIQDAISIQLACVFVNSGGRVGVVNKIVVKVHDTARNCHILKWTEFIKQTDGNIVSDQEIVRAIPLLGRDACFQRIQFSGDYFVCDEGKYSIEVLGWFNRDCNAPPNMVAKRSFLLTQQNVETLKEKVDDVAHVFPIGFDNYQVL